MSWVRPVSIIIALALVLGGCELQRSSQPSVLLVAVEGLSFDSLSCDAEESTDRIYEGIRDLCQEAVRFSHAYTPSTMSQATMASLLTGLYPFDHGVHNNGTEFLSAKFRTLAEGALGRGYHTDFISGGAPIFRKSGLAQGFEVFDDTMDISPGNYYRPARDVVKLATNWIEHEVGGEPFLSVLFLGDLQFAPVALPNKEGELREKSAVAQVEEVAESLGGLVKWLKNKRRWNSTNLVLVGLNSLGRPQETDSQPSTLSLKSASVQVTLFIKPARKEGDNVIQWAVDKNISLVDVGKTMFQWLGLEAPACSIPELEPESLANAVTQSAPKWREDRLIVSETAWPAWLEGSGTRWAVRQNQILFIDDQRPQIYNTLTDRNETLRLKTSDPLWISLNAQVIELLKKAKLPQWRGMNSHWPEQLAIARNLWQDGIADRKPSGREPWAKWYLRRALVNRDWREVKRLSQEGGEPVGTFVAGHNLGENMPIPRDSCVRLILGVGSDKRLYQSECGDERLLALHAWQTAKSDDDRAVAQERFLRLYSLLQLDQEIGRLNYLNDLRWDVDREFPEAPQTIDYLLTLKDLEPYAKKALALVSNKDMTF